MISRYPASPAFTAEQIYALERSWFAKGNPSFSLMQQAAWAASQWLIKYLSAEQSICVVAGVGNNGGDGWLIAAYLKQSGFLVQVCTFGESKSKDAQRAQAFALECGVAVTHIVDEQSKLPPAQVVIDAIFGIGLDKKPSGRYAYIIDQLNAQKKSRTALISIDVPSGLNATTGMVYEGVAVHADITLCFLALKTGLLTKDAYQVAGKVELLPLIPLSSGARISQNKPSQAPTAWVHKVVPKLPKRHAAGHKGSFGQVLVIGGNESAGMHMGGAAILAAQACFQVGAGKVVVACHKAFHAPLLARCPSAMTVNLHQAAAVKEAMDSSDVVAIGMGLGRDTTAFDRFVDYFNHALSCHKHLVVDADALFHLSVLLEQPSIKQQLSSYPNSIWYTPHSGEAARLLNQSVADIEADRFAAVRALARLTGARSSGGGSWLLKGAGSLVYERGRIHICTLGNSGMATAGSGDVLAGVAAGLRAQSHLKANLLDAVLHHAHAGDSAAQELGEYALNAADMVRYLDF